MQTRTLPPRTHWMLCHSSRRVNSGRMDHSRRRGMGPVALGGLLWGLVALAPGGARVGAEDKDLREELSKVVETSKKEFSGEIEKLLTGAGSKLVDKLLESVEKRYAAKVAKLEEDLKSRDKKVAELEAKVKELAVGKPAPPPPPSNAFLGLGHVDVPAEKRAQLKIEGGALVSQVMEGSPAAGAGIQAGDVLVTVEGTAVTSATLSGLIGTFKPDQEVSIALIHDGAPQTKKVKLADREKFLAAQQKKEPPAPPKKEPVQLGAFVDQKDTSLIVASVEDGFTGQVAGLQKDDRITHVNGKEVKSFKEFVTELDQNSGKYTVLETDNNLQIILDREAVQASTPQILSRNNIPAQYSSDVAKWLRKDTARQKATP